MPYHYQAFKAQLAQDIAASQGYGPTNPITFGVVLKPVTGRSHAVVSTSVSREAVGRGVHEQYSYSIGLRFLKSQIPSTGDTESFLMSKAEALIARLAPCTDDPQQIPEYENYAGIGFENYVTAVEPTDGQEADADMYVTVVVDFQVKATVWQ
jgi:hypothetical protein